MDFEKDQFEEDDELSRLEEDDRKWVCLQHRIRENVPIRAPARRKRVVCTYKKLSRVTRWRE
jgi:hypothetical protein